MACSCVVCFVSILCRPPVLCGQQACTPPVSPSNRETSCTFRVWACKQSGHVLLLQDIGSFQQHSVRLLTSLAQCMAPFSLDYTPSLLEQYMHLFCKTARLQLLLQDYPSRLVVQLYTLVWG